MRRSRPRRKPPPYRPTSAPRSCAAPASCWSSAPIAIAEIMARETGKAIKDAKAEIIRSQDTLSLSAEEAVRIEGEHVPLDASAMGAGKICFMLRFPVGVVAGDHAVQRAGQSRLPQDRAGDRGRKYAGAEGAAAIAGRHPRAGADLRRCRHAGRRAQRALRRNRRPGAGARSPRRLHHLYRLAARRRRDQGGVRPAARRARARRQRRHHRARRRRRSPRPRRSARAIRCGSPARAASRCRPSMSTAASIEHIRRSGRRRGEEAQARRSARSRDRRRHPDRRARSAARRNLDQRGGDTAAPRFSPAASATARRSSRPCIADAKPDHEGRLRRGVRAGHQPAAL